MPLGLGRPPYTGVASRGLQVWLASLGSPSRGLAAPADVAIGLCPLPTPRLNSKFTPFFPPSPHPGGSRPDLGPKVPRDVLPRSSRLLKDPAAWEWNSEAAALRSEITSGLSSRLSLRSISRTR